MIARIGDGSDPGIQPQLGTVVHGVSDRRNGQLIRADDRTGRGIKRTDCVLRNIRFQSTEPRGVDDLQPLDAVCHAPVVEVLYLPLVLVVEADDEGAVVFVLHAQLAADGFHHLRAADVQLCLQRALLRVKTGMDDCGVRTACPGCNIVFCFEDADLQVICRKRPCNHSANHAGAYDSNIKHTIFSFFTEKNQNNHLIL